MKKNYLLLVLLTFLCIKSYGQAATCANADPFCAGGSALTFPNTVSAGPAEAGIDYDCLFTQPNPAWFYLQISVAGNLNFFISQQNAGGGGLDVDFIAWGPFATPLCGGANLNAGTQVACSYSAAATESFTISNAQVGEVYMLLLTNFSNQAGQISLTQTNSGQAGAGATDCNIVCPLSIVGAAPPCPQTTLTAQYLNASAPTFQWYSATGPITGATGASYSTNVPGDYTVVANSPGCYANASATVTIPPPTPAPVTQPPATLSECGPAPANFDLTQNDAAYMGLDPNIYSILGYYLDPAVAQSGGPSIPNAGSYPGTDGQTIYVAIEDSSGGCITVLPFTLDIIDCGPIPPPDQVVCDDVSNNGTEIFNLAALIPGILGSHDPADYTVTFHTSQLNADNDVVDVTPANAYVGGPNQTIYIRMEENATGLYGTAFFQLIVNPQPATPNPADVVACNSYTLLALPLGQSYHAGTVTGPVIPAGTVITTTQTIVILAESGTTPNCTANGDFTVTINLTPVAPNPADVTACDSYILPSLPTGQTYHSGSAAGPVVPVGTVITITQTIYVVAATGTTPNCTSSGDFIVTINVTPTAPNPADVSACDSYILPALPNGQSYHAGSSAGPVIPGGTAITTTQTIIILAETATVPNCTAEGDFVVTIFNTPAVPNPADVTACDSYVLPALPAGQTYHAGSATGAIIPATTAITTTQTIFIVAETATTPNCSSNGDFVVTIVPTPVAPNPTDVTVCDSYLLPALPANQTYHAGTTTGPVITAGTPISTTQTIVIVAETGTTPNCTSEGDFVVTVNLTPPAPNPADVTACDSYTLPILSAGQTYHDTTPTGPIIPGGTIITATQTIYIVAESGTTPNCSSNGKFAVIINPTPATPNPADVTVCDSYMLPGLPPGQTYHAGTAAGPIVPVGTVITTTQTIVVLAETSTAPYCSAEGDFVVTVNVTPVAPNPADVTICDSYILPVLSAGQTYHAGSVTGPIIPDGTVITSTQTIVIVAETGTTPNCSSNGDFVVTINVTPATPNPADVTVCDSYILPVLSAGQTYHAGTAGGPIIPDGTVITTTQTIVIVAETGTIPNCTAEGDFIVTVNITPIADAPANVVSCDSYTLPSLNVGNYFTGPNGTGTPYSAGDIITAAHTTLYVYAQTGTTPNCTDENSFDIDIFYSPVINHPSDIHVCDDNNDGFSCLFVLSDRDAQITGGNSSLTVSYHETLTDSQTGANPIANVGGYCNIVVDTQTLYVRVFDPAAPGCYTNETLVLYVDPVPVPNPVIADYAHCDDNAVPGAGQEVFDLTTMDAVILNGQTGITVTYYETNADAVAGTNPIANPSAYVNTASPQQICARLQNNTSGCFAVACFNIVVNPLPLVTPSQMNACGTASGIATFNLTTQDLTVSGGVLGMSVSYYLDAATTVLIPNPATFQNTVNPQTVYALVRNNATGCSAVATVTLTVSQGPPASTPSPLQVCDPNNDCFAPFDLTGAMTDIFGSPAPPAGVSVSFHETLTDAQNGQTPIGNPASYTNIVACDQVIYVSVAYDATGCRTVVELALHVNLTPVAIEIPALQVCDDDTDGIGTFDLNAAIPAILGSLDPAQHTVTFYLTQADAQAPANQITNVLGFHNTIPGAQTIWVRVQDNNTGCFDVIDLDLIVNPKPGLPPTPTGAAVPYSKCDYNNPGDEIEEFDLSTQIPGILNGQVGVTVTFYLTQADALAQANALANLYLNTANAQTLWVRMENQLTGCFVLTTMDLRVEPLPELIPPPGADTTLCDADGDGFAQFDLDGLTLDMLQGAPNIDITFHETLTDAQNGVNPEASPYLNIVAYLQPMYVRAENTLTGCWSVMMIELRAIPSPVVPPLDDITRCDTDANDQDGVSIFDLTIQQTLILNSQVGPGADYAVSYHVSQSDADQGINPIVGAANYSNITNPQTIWVRVEGIASECANVGSFELHVNSPLALTTPGQLTICDDGPTSALPTAVFDLTIKDAEILGTASGYTVSYYETQADALADTNVIANPEAYTNIANAQTLFVAVKGPAPSFCRSFTTLTIRVLPLPVPVSADIPVLEACDENAPTGTETFDLTQNEAYIRDNDPQLGFEYYTTLAAAEAGDNTAPEYIGTPASFETATGVIYIRVERTSEPDYQGEFCYVIVEQQVIVNPLPQLAATDALGCDTSGTGANTYQFTLGDYNAALLLAGQDVADFTFTHYPSLADAQGGTNQLPASYLGTDGEVITVKVVNDATGCVAYVELTLRVAAGAFATDAAAAPVCDTDSDGLMDVDLTQFDATVLGGQDPAQFTVAYFATQAGAIANNGALTSPHNMATGALYAVVTNTTTGCRSQVAIITVDIEPLVDIAIESVTPDGISNSICVDFVTGALISGLTLDSGLPNDGTYTFQWTLGGADIAGATASTYTISDPAGFGDYGVRATTALGCVSTSPVFTVVQSGPAAIPAGTTGYTVSNYFADEQTITVTVQGYGTYHYQLDNGPILDNGGVFTNVSPPGVPHTVTIYDMEGNGTEHCDAITITGIMIVDYPKFFTPNGDGINDTWNIVGLDPFAKIFIYDRYGKLLKQISPVGEGWNGTYNSQPLPSTDYWFTVEYPEASVQNLPVMKEFKAHFSLKR
jgi:gliding motility-associated-like protein